MLAVKLSMGGLHWTTCAQQIAMTKCTAWSRPPLVKGYQHSLKPNKEGGTFYHMLDMVGHGLDHHLKTFSAGLTLPLPVLFN